MREPNGSPQQQCSVFCVIAAVALLSILAYFCGVNTMELEGDLDPVMAMQEAAVRKPMGQRSRGEQQRQRWPQVKEATRCSEAREQAVKLRVFAMYTKTELLRYVDYFCLKNFFCGKNQHINNKICVRDRSMCLT